MSKKLSLFVVFVCYLVLWSCADNDQPESAKNFTLTGNVFCIGAEDSGIKVSLVNTDDPSLKYIAVTDQAGNFEFQDIVGGIYYIDAAKDGVVYGWYKDGNYTNQRDRIINIFEDKYLEICVQCTSSSRDFDLDITDMAGKPIGNSISISNQTTTVAFRLYNKTTSSRYWYVRPNDCFVTDDIGYKIEYVFSSFSQTSGTLKPGDAIVIVGTINQKIFSVCQSSPRYQYTTLNFHSDFNNKDVYLDIEF